MAAAEGEDGVGSTEGLLKVAFHPGPGIAFEEVMIWWTLPPVLDWGRSVRLFEIDEAFDLPTLRVQSVGVSPIMPIVAHSVC
jgi:hypothetical protein